MGKWQSCLHCGGQVKKDRALYCSDACKMKAYRRRLDPLAGSSISNKQRIRQSVTTKASQVVGYVCPVCGGDYKRSGLESLREYCSDACKQKAYRARKKESSSLWSVGDAVTTDTGRTANIKEMRGTTACIVTEKIGAMLIDRYHTLKRLSPAAQAAPAPYMLHMGDHPYVAPAPTVAPARPATEALFLCGGGPQGIQGLIDRVGVAYRERYGHGWLFDEAKIVLRNGGYFADVADQSYYLNSFKHAKAAVIDYYERGVMNWSLVREGMPVPSVAE